jgi:glycerophosphoryl diester phosphodiesterase
LPALLVDDRSAASALTYTHNPLREMKRRVGAVVFSFWTAIILLPFALAQGFHSVGGRVFTRLSEEHRLVMPVVLMLMAGYVATAFIGEFLTVAVNSLTITRLYAGLRQTRGAKKGDTVLSHIKTAPQERKEQEAEYPLPSGVTEPVAPHSSRCPHPRQIVAFMILATVVSLAAAATILSDFDLHDNVKITAHRGGSFSAPENTLAAIYRAIEEGADYAEVDVRLTADGYAVLLHDKDLLRVARVKDSLSDLTYDQIRTLDVGSWFAPQFRDERIPLLSDVVAFSAGRIRLNVELKIDGAPYRLAERVVQILHEHDAVSECVVSSASIEALEHLRNLDPSLRTGCVISQSIGEVAALDVDFLSVSSRLATPGLIGAAHAAGREVHVWTVDKPRQMARFIDLGVDNLITDLPSVARSLLDERAAMSTEELLFTKVRSWFLR